MVVAVVVAVSCTTSEGVVKASGPPTRSSVTRTVSPARPSPSPTPEVAQPAFGSCTRSLRTVATTVKAHPDVPRWVTREVRAAAQDAHRALSSVPLPGCDERQTVVNVLPGAGAANTAAQFQQVSTRRGVITIWTDDWARLATEDRILVLAHEWWHQVQELSAWCGADAGCRNEDLRKIPHWLFEADANLQALRIGQRLGVVSYLAEVQRWSGFAGGALVALRRNTDPADLSPDTTFWWYKMAQFAGHDLVEDRPRVFLQFWRLAGRTGDWQRAFRIAFGVEYDTHFERTFVHRERLWP